MLSHNRGANHRLNHQNRRRIQFAPILEQLEARRLLAADLQLDYEQPAAAWYARWNHEALQAAAVAAGAPTNEWFSEFVGPRLFQRNDWIVRLTADATQSLASIEQATAILNQNNIDFQIVAGLGLPGLLHVNSLSKSSLEVETSLATNSRVASYAANDKVGGQVLPNDSDFGNMTGLHNVGQFGASSDADIDAPEAWDITRGSPSVVVGVVDSGIDATHPDLYLNIWLNQGEIPAAKRSALIDTDTDGLFTFYDLNNTANASQVRDLNANGYIDAIDLLDDPLWADGRDTDGNGFTDDFFGWNFRTDSNETFAPNNPSDVLGHGTHVAGTIGAIGNNARGVTGINWRSSIMALKFLDVNNQGDTASAIAAVNYATMMRTQFNTNVRVLNNSWGQPGGSNIALKNTIEASGNAGLLFVAAAGNGNILGQGVDNDRTAFYPASYEMDNVIAVGASDGTDRLAGFSNYGLRGVDIVAPGVGVRSTLPGGRYGEANGTSMATPHVSGSAALVWSLQPDATVPEIRRALLEQGDLIPAIGSQISTGRRLNANKSLAANVFAPTVQLVSAANITIAGGTEQLITVKYKNRLGVDKASLGNSDIEITRQAALDETLTTTLVSSTENANKTEVTAIYRLAAVGGSWDAEDYGNYSITAKSDAARSLSGLASRETIVGSFQVKIAAAGIFYVDTFLDTVDANPGDGLAKDALGRTSLRAAIQEANALKPQPVKIFLQTGTYPLTIASVIDASVNYPVPPPGSGYDAPAGLQWSNASSGDLDLQGNITLVGLGVNRTTIDAKGIDRVMKVYAGSTVFITGLTLTGGNAPTNHSGGGILNNGYLTVAQTRIVDNTADDGFSALGGGIAAWGGELMVRSSTLGNNQASGGGGLFSHDASKSTLDSVSLVGNRANGIGQLHRHQVGGGGVFATENAKIQITNSTFSENQVLGVGPGSAVSKYRPPLENGPSIADGGLISSDGRYISFGTPSALLPSDVNYITDAYLYDRQTKEYELLSVASDGTKANNSASPADVSRNGRYVTFRTLATNLDPDDKNNAWDLYWRDRLTGLTKRVSVGTNGIGANDSSLAFDLSDGGKHIIFRSYASNLTPDDNNGIEDIFLHSVDSNETVRVSRGVLGTEPVGGGGGFAISSNGRYAAFDSSSGDFVAGDENQAPDVFLRDMLTDEIIRVSTSITGRTPNGHSSLPAISADGQSIAFISWASDLVADDNNQFADIYAFDRMTRSNQLITKGWDGTPANGPSDIPSISANGRFITFHSSASNLVPDDTDGFANYFVYDRMNRQMHRISTATVAAPRAYTSVSDDGVIALTTSAKLVPQDLTNYTDGYTYDLVSQNFENFTASPNDFWGTGRGGWSSSNDEEWLVFASNARLNPSDQNEFRDVYLWNTKTNTTTLVSRGFDGTAANGNSSSVIADESGRRVIFQSTASNLIPNDTNGLSDLFLFDRQEGSLRRVLANTPNTTIVGHNLSRDGLTIIFESTSPNWVPNDTNGSNDLFSLDIATGLITRISTLSSGQEANGQSTLFSMNSNAQFVVFVSAASNLVPGDFNGQADVFVKSTVTGAIERVSVGLDGSEAVAARMALNDGTYRPFISSDGRFVSFKSSSPNLVAGDLNDTADLFVFDRTTRKTSRLSVGTNGNEDKGNYGAAKLSDDGRYAIFPSSTDFRGYGALEALTRLVVRDRVLGTTDSFDFSYPMPQANSSFAASNYNFVNNQKIFFVGGQTPGWYDLRTGQAQTIKKTDQMSMQEVVLNHVTIIDDGQRLGEQIENIVSGDVLVANSIVTKPHAQMPAGAVSGGYIIHNGLPTFLNTWFPKEFELKAILLSDGGVVYSIPSGSIAQSAASKVMPVARDQRGVERLGLQELGAVEIVGGIVQGDLFVDKDGDSIYSEGDSGLENQRVFVDYNFNGIRDIDEPSTLSRGKSTSTQADKSGEFLLEGLRAGVFPIVPELKEGQIYRSSRFIDRLPLSSTTESIDISSNGSLLAFATTESKHVAGDTNGVLDVYVFDRVSANMTRVSNGLRGVEPNGDSFGATISSDGRFVAFLSNATNLVDGDTNGVTDAFLTNLSTRETIRVNVSNGGTQSKTAALGTIELSRDGGLIAFAAISDAFENGIATLPVVFVRDTQSRTTFQITQIDEGLRRDESRGTQFLNASFSDDFQFVAFTSVRTDLVPNDNNNSRDAFVLNRLTQTISRVSIGAEGQEPNGPSNYASISGNGNVVAFISNAGNMYVGDSTVRPELMLRNLSRNTTSKTGVPISDLCPVYRPSLSFDGSRLAVRGYTGGEEVHGSTVYLLFDATTNKLTEVGKSAGVSTSTANRGTYAVISGQGNHVAFTVPDTNQSFTPGTFVWDSRLSPGTVTRITDGQVSSVALAVSLASGEISGTVFQDSIPNQVMDFGESGISGGTVFLDLDADGLLDTNEPRTSTDENGRYRFLALDPLKEYSIAIAPFENKQQSTPANAGSWKVYLEPGKSVTDRNFGFVPSVTGGQFENAVLTGKLFNDINGDGLVQNGEAALVGVTVYLDLNGNEARDFNEPRAVTDSEGSYSFSGLGNRPYTVRTLLATGTVQTSPLGTKFATTPYTLTTGSTQLANPQDVIADDLNGDGWSDLAVALFSGNSVAIRLNDKAGGFGGAPVSVSVAPDGLGPIALASGKLNSGTAVDMISANQLNGTATILLDFHGSGFASKQTLAVGETPTDVVVGKFDADADFDAIVANLSTDQLTLLVNNGSGVFAKGASFSSGGKKPTALVTGLFNNDAFVDIAVANYGTHPTGGDFGNVAVLLGRGDGTFQTAVPYTVGFGPISIATDDFNGDGFLDLVTSNFLANTASLLLGSANGTFTVASEQLATGQGPLQVQLQDIEGDGDKDILVTNLLSQTISVLRNRRSQGGSGFEPAENFGVAEFSTAPRLAFAAGDFDKSTTTDIAIINSLSDSLKIMRNTLVNGAHRIQLTGVENVANLNFGTRPDVLLPRMDPIDNPESLVEDAPQQTITLNGIALGRTGGPALRITASSGNASIIPNPTIDYVAGATTGSLRFTPAKDASGLVAVTVTTRDAGADKLLDTDDDAVLSRVFTVSIKPVNDAPTFDFPASRSLTAPEDSGARTVNGFISNITSGGGSYESEQTLTAFLVVADNLALFSAQPVIDASGTLRFTPAANAAGTATVTVTLTDNGDTDFGGTNRKIDQFVLTINPVNDAPSINIGGKQTVLVGAAAQTVSGFATGFAPGGGTDENAQVVAGFVISVDKPDLFSVLPTIDGTGTLRFTPSLTRTGMAKVSVQVRDDGGSNNGGVDLSTLKQFDIEVAPLPDTVASTPTLTSSSPTITNVSPIDLAVDFGEVVTGFALNDLMLTNATAANLTDLGAGKFTVAISPTVDGVVTVSIPASAAKDLANNNSLASTNFTRTVDRILPAATITTTEPSPTNKPSFPVVFNFGEAVTGFDVTDLVIGNGTASAFTETATGRYSATVTAISDGVVFIGFSGGVSRDAAGNGNTSPVPLLISVNTGAASYKPLLSTSESSITPNRSFTATIDFGRVVTGFVVGDLELTNATATISDLSNGRYQLNLSAVSDGIITVRLPADRVRDANNRPNEVSDTLTIRFVDATDSDFGDAPTSVQSGFANSYPTRLVDNGAFHKRSALFLGTSSDAESDGQPSVTATGDDSNGGDDENGILFPLSSVIGVSAATTSSFIAIASATGFLDAWIDFNRDGDWSDAGEQIATKLAMASGSNSVAFTIPPTTSAGTTFARFRLSTAGGLGTTGPATDGEVEDHAVTFVGGATKTVSLNALELGGHEIAISNGLLVIRSGTKALWSAPASEIAKFTTLNDTGAKLFEVSAPATNLPGTVRYSGSGKPIELVSNRSSIDLAVLSTDKLYGVQLVDLRASGIQNLTLRRADVIALNSGKNLRILMDQADTLVALSDWKSQTGRVENSVWVQPYVSDDATIEVVSATPWQNEVNPIDVNGDQGASPLDVLELINQINANSFPGGVLPTRVSGGLQSFYDPDGDSRLGPLDVLVVINELNRVSGGEGESTRFGLDEVKNVDQLMSADLSDILDEWQGGTRKRSALRR